MTCDHGVKELAAAVCAQAATDIRNGRKDAELDVLRGGLELCLAVVGTDITSKEFVKRAKRGRK